MNKSSDMKKEEPRISLWSMLWPKIRPYRWLVLLAMVFNAAHGIAISYQTLMTKYLIDDVVLKTGITMDARMQKLFWLMGAYLAISLIGRMAVWHIGFRIFTYVRERVLMALRLNFFSHVNHLCLRFHRSHKSGELFNYLFGSTLGQIQNYFQQFTLQVPGAVFTLIWTLVWVARWDRVMTAVLSISVITTVLVLNSSRRIMRTITKEFQQTETAVSGYVADLLRGSRDVKLFAIEEQVQEDFSEQVDMIRKKSYEREVKTHLQWMKQEGVGYFCFVLLCIMGAIRFLHGEITIGEFQAYLASFGALQGPLQTIFNVGTQKGGAQASLERLEKVMTTVSSTPDPAKPVQPVPGAGNIVFAGASFRYDEAWVLRNVSITIPYGQHVALVGPSGAGKTTLIQLVLRLYDVSEGSLVLGGADIRKYKGADLRRRFGVVPQDPFIFSTTIRENLQIVAPEAPEQRIIDACKLANAWEFIEKMPEKLDTKMAEAGATLSGGQRQRVAIARALLAEPAYFVLDEATSALDTLSERLIQNSVETAMKGRTALIIAHRLATVRNCDRVLVLENGYVVQDGTYADLTQRPGLFADLVAGQQLRA
jgi:ABC-type multidrug transport system fused ATPase/permease subunit